MAPKTGSTPLPPPAAAKAALPEADTRKKATSIIREWLGPNRNLDEATVLFQARPQPCTPCVLRPVRVALLPEASV